MFYSNLTGKSLVFICTLLLYITTKPGSWQTAARKAKICGLLCTFQLKICFKNTINKLFLKLHTNRLLIS